MSSTPLVKRVIRNSIKAWAKHSWGPLLFPFYQISMRDWNAVYGWIGYLLASLFVAMYQLRVYFDFFTIGKEHMPAIEFIFAYITFYGYPIWGIILVIRELVSAPERAWQGKRVWESQEQFELVQKKWGDVGRIFLGLILLVGILYLGWVLLGSPNL